jgi:hypothetical protein
LSSVGLVTPPTWRGDRHFFLRRSQEQDHPVLVLAGHDGDEQVLIDPMKLDPSRRLETSAAALRRAVGCAFERPALIGRTVQEAITFGSVSPVRALAAAHAAHVHEFVSRLPERYQTSLPEAPISGGEA